MCKDENCEEKNLCKECLAAVKEVVKIIERNFGKVRYDSSEWSKGYRSALTDISINISDKFKK